MAPTTRRKAQVVQETTDTPQDSSPKICMERSKTAKEKRKSISKDVDESLTPKQPKLAMRNREEKANKRTFIETPLPGLEKRPKRSRSESIADPQDGEPEPTSASKQLQEEADQRLSQDLAASQSTQPEPTPAQEVAPATANKSKHVVFGDDDDVERFVAAAAEAPKESEKPAQEEEEESTDDHDEAPEAVSTSAAAKDLLKSEQAREKAAEKHAASLKRKRQDRDNLLKQQAEKRKRVDQTEALETKSTKGANDDNEATAEKSTSTGRRRLDKAKLPDMLPAEFLTDSESESEDDTALIVVKKPTKITFDNAVETLGKEGKKPRDQVMGSTVYRVLANQGDQTLAPKMQKNTRNAKEDLLRRKRVGVAPSKGFFKKK